MEPIAQINFQNLVAFALKLPEGPSSVLSEELLKRKTKFVNFFKNSDAENRVSNCKR